MTLGPWSVAEGDGKGTRALQSLLFTSCAAGLTQAHDLLSGSLSPRLLSCTEAPSSPFSPNSHHPVAPLPPRASCNHHLVQGPLPASLIFLTYFLQPLPGPNTGPSLLLRMNDLLQKPESLSSAPSCLPTVADHCCWPVS